MQVTVFEKEGRPGGAFRYAGKAPLFQEVEASERSFERYIADLRRGLRCQGRHLPLRDRCHSATGACSRRSIAS